MSTDVSTDIRAHDLDDIAVGAAVLGAGGGGNPYVGRLLAATAVADGCVPLLSLDSLADDAFVLPVAMMGAPTIMVEKLPAGTELGSAVAAVERAVGRPATHLMPIEAGGINAMIPFAAAARTGLPVVDADLMGRAFPELQMCTPTLYGGSATPMAVADDKGNTVLIDAVSNRWAERLARVATVEMGCTSIIALYPMTGAQARQRCIPGTLGMSAAIGALVRAARTGELSVPAALAGRLGARRVFTGKVGDVRRETTRGFARAVVGLDGTGPDTGRSLRLESQNEWLVATLDGAVVATTPSLIVALDADSGVPIPAEDVRYGYRLDVLVIPCDPRWTTPDGLALTGPRAFGYDVDFVPPGDARPVRQQGASA